MYSYPSMHGYLVLLWASLHLWLPLKSRQQPHHHQFWSLKCVNSRIRLSSIGNAGNLVAGASSATTHSDTTGVTRYALHCHVTLLEISDGAWEENMCIRNYVCTVFTIWIWKVSVKQHISRSFHVIIIVILALVRCIYKLFATPPIGTLKNVLYREVYYIMSLVCSDA